MLRELPQGDYEIRRSVIMSDVLTLVFTTIIVFYTTEILKFLRDKLRARRGRKKKNGKKRGS